jgi:hypothetical protein
MTSIVENKAWVETAKKQHARLLRFAKTKGAKHPAEWSQRLRAFKRKGYHRTLGYESFEGYASKMWPASYKAQAVALERLAGLFERMPQAEAVLKGRLLDSQRLARIAHWIETEEDLLWLVRLGRVTTDAELRGVAHCLAAYGRSGDRFEHGSILVLFLRDEERRAVEPYLCLKAGSKAQPVEAGSLLAALCRQARDAGIPCPVGESRGNLGEIPRGQDLGGLVHRGQGERDEVQA